MMRTAIAAALYFAVVFGAGFLFGVIRVLLLDPRLGPFIAVLCEAPFMLAVIVAAARWVPHVVRLPADLTSHLLMGLGAVALQQVADVIVGSTLRGVSPAEQLAQFSRPEGKVYALLLVLFVIMPALLNASVRTEGRSAD